MNGDRIFQVSVTMERRDGSRGCRALRIERPKYRDRPIEVCAHIKWDVIPIRELRYNAKMVLKTAPATVGRAVVAMPVYNSGPVVAGLALFEDVALEFDAKLAEV